MGVYGIVPDNKNGIYLGGFFNHVEDEEHLYCFENASKQDIDIAMRFVSFAEIDGGDVFPKEEALTMYKMGGALFIKLEPWSAAGPDDDSFKLKDILDGVYDKQLKAFATQARKSGVPIFVTFGHEPQITDKYPWGKDPKVYKEAFRYVHDKISLEYGADNVSWVWNPNVEIASGHTLLDYDPQFDSKTGTVQTGRYYKYVALDGYHPRSGQTFQAIYEPSLALVTTRYPGMDFIIGEFGSSGTDIPDRTAIFNEAIEYVTNQGATKHPYKIFAYLYFDVDDEGNAFSIIKPADKAAYATALKTQDDLFRRTTGYGLFERNIQLTDNSYLDSDPLEKPETPCSEVEGTWYGWWEKKTLKKLNKGIKEAEKSFIATFGVRTGDSHEDNKTRISLAKNYVTLTNYVDSDNKARIDEQFEKAIAQLVTALNNFDPALHHFQSLPYVRYYFEARLQLAEVFRDSGHFEESIAICQDILSDQNEDFDFATQTYKEPYLHRGGLYNLQIRVAHNVRPEAVPGMESRAKSILADNYVLMGSAKLEDAKKLYQETIDWANGTTNYAWATSRPYVPNFIGYALNWTKIAYQTGELSQPRDKILYLSAIAQLGKAEILIRQGKIDEALQIYTAILNWEEVGKEKGFLDLAFKSMIGAMYGCAASGNYNQAVQMFSDKLPWGKIDQYTDLKESLNAKGKLLEPLPPKEKWELMEYRLRNIHIEPKYREKLKKVILLVP
ncbi:MAG: hypothetical protein WC890_07430 [Candidatus Margulisiibacteriota bacterium]